MSNNGFYQTAFAFALLTTPGWILFTVGGLTSPGQGELGDLEDYLAGTESTALKVR